MPLNDPGAPQSAVRKPRVRILINGTNQPDGRASFSGGDYLDGVMDVDITSNNWYTCDRFNVTLAIKPGSIYNAGWWSDQTDIAMKLEIGFLPDGALEGGANIQWTTIIQGGVDQVSVDPVQGTVTLDGRDLSYLLIESRTQEEFLNHKSSQIVTELANRHGLTPIVTATTTPVDRYYASDHTKTTHGTFHRQTTEWDLCVFLAQREQFDLFVTGRELHFQPKATPNSDPYVVRYAPASGDVGQRLSVLSLRMQRALLIAKDIQVEVRSWSTKNKEPVTAIARKTGFGRVSAGGTSRAKGGASVAQNYVYIYPNLSKDQAQQRAEQILKDLSQHERIIEFDEPGNMLFSPRRSIKLIGTNTSWDQRYFVDHIRRTLSHHSGFKQTVRAKNVDTASQIVTD